MRRMWLVAVVVAGCQFGVKGLDDTGGGQDDLAGASDDLAGVDEADMAGGFLPSHADPGSVHPGASDLTGITSIDTTNFTLNGQLAPAGIAFVPDAAHGEWVVLSVGGWSIDQNVRVTGT